jgi:hypothetical protein
MKMKKWLKGGLIGGIIGGIVGLVLWLSTFYVEWHGDSLRMFLNSINLQNSFMFLGSPLCYALYGGEEKFGWCWLLYGHVLNIILFFIIGAIIGLIIGKIKQKEENN